MSKLILENNTTLPKSWAITSLQLVVHSIVDKDHTTPKYVDFNGIPLISPKDFTLNSIDFTKPKLISIDEYNKICKKCEPKFGDLLYSRIGTIGEVRKVPKNRIFNILHSLVLIRPNLKIMFGDYLFYFLQSEIIKSQSRRDTKSIGTPDLGIVKIRNFEVYLPPINEQKRIILKIEELFSELDKTKDILEKTKLQLKQYQQSLLEFAFEGKLTEKWREENECNVESELDIIRKFKDTNLKIDSKLLIDIPETISELHKIPEKWIWIRLGFLSKLITKGASPKWQGIDYVDNGILFITSENVGSGRILLNKPKYLEKKFNEIQKRSILQKGDILTNIVGASIGRTAIYDLDSIANINQAVSLIRVFDQVNIKYVQYVLNSPSILNYMNQEKVDVARANLSLQNVADFPIPLPSIKEQELIVLKLEQSFSLIKNTENITNSMLTQLNIIKSSILKQAFEGKLVPQDPNDEPASKLLEQTFSKN